MVPLRHSPLAVLSALSRGVAAQQQAAVHRLALHVDQNDLAVIAMALGNASNPATYYAQRGEAAAVELVAYVHYTCCAPTRRR
jgi:hypothetical protein